MLDRFKNHITNHLSFLQNSKLLIAISGGLDSVVLTHLCHKSGLNIALAHCNFNLRGDESDEDELFVSKLAEELTLELFANNFETTDFAQANKLSTQMAARELRYDWFFDLADHLKYDYILTAHHADDNLETFLINLTRGTGLQGLTGIPEVNGKIVRPLLPFSREDLERYARREDVKWREDSSNASKKYLRNKLRHDIIPTLKEMNPQLLQNFQNTLSHLSDSQEVIDDAIAKLQNKVVSMDGSLIKLDVKKLKTLSKPKSYLFELLKDFNFTEWDDVADLLTAQSGKQVVSKSHRLIKDRDFLLLSEIKSIAKECISISKEQSKVQTSLGLLILEEADAVVKTDKNTIFVDADILNFPLTVRSWEEGDCFYPLGMKGKKKVSKYFKDEKLSLIEKEQVRLLCSNNEIICILGRRPDERYKVTDGTKCILKIAISDLPLEIDTLSGPDFI